MKKDGYRIMKAGFLLASRMNHTLVCLQLCMCKIVLNVLAALRHSAGARTLSERQIGSMAKCEGDRCMPVCV